MPSIISGLLLSIAIAIISFLIEYFLGGSKMLYALIIGIGLNFMLKLQPNVADGIQFSAKTVLRVGVALLGVRISFADFQTLGLLSVIWLFTGVTLTILSGIFISRLLGFSKELGVLSGGSVGICGASAALAISSVLPQNEDVKNMTVFTVVVVTAFSTIAMVLYPVIVTAMGLTDMDMSFILGGAIHDVAQVVGAGGLISEEVQTLSVMVKLTRVAALVPIVIIISLTLNKESTKDKNFISLVPIFLIGFIILVIINSFSLIPENIRLFLVSLSSWLLLIAISALGVKTKLKDLFRVGLKPFLLFFLESLFILLFMVLGVYII